MTRSTDPTTEPPAVPDLMTALRRSIEAARRPTDRYAQCHGDCTTDCGACKGRGRPEDAGAIDVAHLQRQAEWSRETFGPGDREAGVSDHIRKELIEVRDAATPEEKRKEWIDVVILALDGAWRSGMTPAEIIAAVKAKQARNEARTWPDWRTAPADRAIEHVRVPYYVDRAGREHQR